MPWIAFLIHRAFYCDGASGSRHIDRYFFGGFYRIHLFQLPCEMVVHQRPEYKTRRPKKTGQIFWPRMLFDELNEFQEPCKRGFQRSSIWICRWWKSQSHSIWGDLWLRSRRFQVWCPCGHNRSGCGDCPAHWSIKYIVVSTTRYCYKGDPWKMIQSKRDSW